MKIELELKIDGERVCHVWGDKMSLDKNFECAMAKIQMEYDKFVQNKTANNKVLFEKTT